MLIGVKNILNPQPDVAPTKSPCRRPCKRPCMQAERHAVLSRCSHKQCRPHYWLDNCRLPSIVGRSLFLTSKRRDACGSQAHQRRRRPRSPYRSSAPRPVNDERICQSHEHLGGQRSATLRVSSVMEEAHLFGRMICYSGALCELRCVRLYEERGTDALSKQLSYLFIKTFVKGTYYNTY